MRKAYPEIYCKRNHWIVFPCWWRCCCCCCWFYLLECCCRLLIDCHSAARLLLNWYKLQPDCCSAATKLIRPNALTVPIPVIFYRYHIHRHQVQCVQSSVLPITSEHIWRRIHVRHQDLANGSVARIWAIRAGNVVGARVHLKGRHQHMSYCIGMIGDLETYYSIVQ